MKTHRPIPQISGCPRETKQTPFVRSSADAIPTMKHPH
jgi:hypothetical protein